MTVNRKVKACGTSPTTARRYLGIFSDTELVEMEGRTNDGVYKVIAKKHKQGKTICKER